MIQSNIIEFDQSEFTGTGVTPKSISFGQKGYMYVPTQCQSGQLCKLTFVFHGCSQTTADVQEKFYSYIGMNEWAESNNIIVVYPQAIKSYSSPSNPNGCFDWWGYTDSLLTDTYATNQGAQMKTIRNMIKGFIGF